MTVTQIDLSDMLSVKEAAHALGVTRRTVERWIRDGRIVAYEIGPSCRIRIPRESVELARAPRVLAR